MSKETFKNMITVVKAMSYEAGKLAQSGETEKSEAEELKAWEYAMSWGEENELV